MKSPLIGVGPHVTIQLTMKIIIFMENLPFILFYHILKWIYPSPYIHVEVTRLFCSNWNQTWHVSNMNREIDFHGYWMDEINFLYFVFYIQHEITSTNFQHDSVINRVDFFFTMEDFITMWMFNFLLHPLDSTKIDHTTSLSNSARTAVCSNHVYMNILCLKFGQQLSRGSGAKLSPSFTFQPFFFPEWLLQRFHLAKPYGEKFDSYKKRFELEIVNSYSWLLTSFLQIFHTCWGVQLNDHHSKNYSIMINNMKKTQNKQHFILNVASSFM